jgi:hypothetical protein
MGRPRSCAQTQAARRHGQGRRSDPTPEASARLYDELLFQRTVQVYLWALPGMNMVAMRDGQARSAAVTTSSPSSRTAPTPRPSSPPLTRT